MIKVQVSHTSPGPALQCMKWLYFGICYRTKVRLTLVFLSPLPVSKSFRKLLYQFSYRHQLLIQVSRRCTVGSMIFSSLITSLLSNLATLANGRTQIISWICHEENSTSLYKTVTCKSKGFLCLFGHNSCKHCFCLKNLNLFSQNITFRVINYLNLLEKIIRNWNVDEVSVPIISKDIR